MEILKQIEALEEQMIRWRRELHIHPELSGQEHSTCAMICEKLTEAGVEWTVIPDGGILGRIEGCRPGRTVLLRADVDALPIEEDSCNMLAPKECISSVPGVSHACGHDAHTAMLLAATHVLSVSRSEFSGTVLLMFERGEEKTGNVIKIYRYLEDNDIHVDSCFGLHVNAMLDSGLIAINNGPVMASNVCFDIKIKGKSAHGSQPHLGASPIDCFVAFYNALHTIRMRKISPFDPLTFSIGMLQSGSTNNIIPDELFLRGSSRFFRVEDGQIFKQTLTQTLDHVTQMYDCTYEYSLLRGPCMPVINDPECALLAQQASGEAIGAQRVCQCEPKMGSETFGKPIRMWPGVFALLGVRNTAKGMTSDYHTPQFDPDESSFKYGAAAYAAYAVAFLQSDVDPSPRRYQGDFADMYEEQGVNQEMIDYLRGKTDDLILN